MELNSETGNDATFVTLPSCVRNVISKESSFMVCRLIYPLVELSVIRIADVYCVILRMDVC